VQVGEWRRTSSSERGSCVTKLTLAVYGATDRSPIEERYGLTSQARRAAHSAAANIVEGWARHGGRELCRYLSISRGSLAELGYTLRLAHDRAHLSEVEWRELNGLRGAAEAITWRLYQAVKATCGSIA
jgi:four helix bundle protein